MCGIAGILNHEPEFPESVPAIERMWRALRHRGPDDGGTYLSPGPITAALAHTRLSIIDLSANARQPMSDSDGVPAGWKEAPHRSDQAGRYWITFNGEIYNFAELRLELEALGDTFKSKSDTEVLLKLYQRYGSEFLVRLRGMYAFAIWDEREGTCFLARDPLGIKPLYYHARDGLLVFASEVRALLASNLVERRLSGVGLYGYLCTGSVPEPETLIEGVRCLEAGHWLLWKKGEMTSRRFWNLAFEPKEELVGERAVHMVRNSLLDSVRYHFVSDVPIGIFLSGGIDSTALLALARATGQKDLRTFTISFDDPALDESAMAARTAKHFGVQHSELRIGPEFGRELFGQFLTSMDQPSIDGLNALSISRFAREAQMKVVLSGVGGDELFGGYPSFRRVPAMAWWSRRLGIFGPLQKMAGSYLAARGKTPPARRMGEFLSQSPSVLNAYKTYRGVFTDHDAGALLEGFGFNAEGLFDADRFEEPVSPMDGVCALEVERYMRNQLLRDSDVMSMACGLELRVPFVDRRLVEALGGIPAAKRYQPGKRLLLDAVPEIPPWVANAPKRAFAFPFQRWLDSDWKEMFARTTRRNGTRAQGWYQKWSLFVLENWCAAQGILGEDVVVS